MTTDIEPVQRIAAPPHSGNYFIDVAIENMERLRVGDATPAETNAIATQASVVLRFFALQLAMHKLQGTVPNIPLLLSGANGNGKVEDEK